MLRYTIICLTLAALSAATDRRSARSIWPFGTSEVSTEEPIITEEHNRLLEQAGLGKKFNLSSHPLWRIHKYQGIDLKPVHVKTEIVPATSPKPELPATTTTEAADLSFLDDLGGLAYFLPEPKDNGDDEGEGSDDDEAIDLIADAIKKEEEKEVGFFKGLWQKIVGGPSGFFSSMFGGEKEVNEGRQVVNDEDDSTTIYLPETQGSYVAVVIPSSEAPLEALVPSNEASQFRETLIAPTEQTTEGPVPSNHASQFRESPIVPQAPARPSYTQSSSWVQSWSPYASYSVHIKGEPTKIDNNSNTGIFDRPVTRRTNYQRKIGQADDEIEQTTTEQSTTLQPQEVKEEEPKKNDTTKDSYLDFLKTFPLTEAHWKKLQITKKDVDEVLNDKEKAQAALKRIQDKQIDETLKKLQVTKEDIDAILNNKEEGARALERIKNKQAAFITNWLQLKYSRVRKQNHESTTTITTGIEA